MKNLPFLSPAMLDAVNVCAGPKGQKLGLRMDVTLCSGWPYGGPATTLADAATRLRTIEVAVAAGRDERFRCRSLAKGESVDLGFAGGRDADSCRLLAVSPQGRAVTWKAADCAKLLHSGLTRFAAFRIRRGWRCFLCRATRNSR